MESPLRLWTKSNNTVSIGISSEFVNFEINPCLLCYLDMGAFYRHFCSETGRAIDQALFSKMSSFCEKKIKEFDEKIEDATANLGETEIREANLEKSEFLCRVGDKEGALAAFEVTFEKTVSLGQRLDIVFNIIRIGLFYMDHKLITKNIERAKT